MKLRNKTDKYLFARNGDGISMYHPSGYQVPDHEPILIFRAKDVGVLAAIAAYLDMLCEQEPSATIRDHILSMLDVTDSILEYQSDHSIKSVTCSVKAHASTLAGLRSDVDGAVIGARHVLRDVYGVES